MVQFAGHEGRSMKSVIQHPFPFVLFMIIALMLTFSAITFSPLFILDLGLLLLNFFKSLVWLLRGTRLLLLYTHHYES